MYSSGATLEDNFRLVGPPAFPRAVLIESDKLDACMDYALRNRNRLAGIAVAPLDGFKLPDLSFVSKFPWIDRLTILDSDEVDISAISGLKSLQYLQISGATKQTIHTADFPSLAELRVQWWNGLIFDGDLSALRVLSLGKYVSPTGDMSGLSSLPHLVDLNLVQSRNLMLSGIDRFPHLKRLSVSYLSKLYDLSPLSSFADGVMESLEFGNCPNIVRHDQVRVLRTLKRLAFNKCGSINSIKFLDELPALESFSFVGTDVVDGDLTPCLRLRFVGFLDKRHYSHRRSDFPAATIPTKIF